jgi:hypothetical protein
LGSWSSQVGSLRENPLDRNWVALRHENALVQEPTLLDIWVALRHENPLVQEPPLLDICKPVTFRQSCVNCYVGKVPLLGPQYLWDHKNNQKETEISTHLLKKARWVFTQVIWILPGGRVPCDLILFAIHTNGQ